MDVFSFDKPVADSGRFLEMGNELASRVATKNNWKPSDLIGENGSDSATKAKTASYAAPDQWDKITDPRSATSTGHIPIYPRPEGVGLGWGGYDNFTHWQACGRRITKGMVKKENWSADRIKTTKITSNLGRTFEVPRMLEDETDLPPRPNSPVTLYERLNPSESRKAAQKSEERCADFIGTRSGRKAN